jgi:hypothetical protein
MTPGTDALVVIDQTLPAGLGASSPSESHCWLAAGPPAVKTPSTTKNPATTPPSGLVSGADLAEDRADFPTHLDRLVPWHEGNDDRPTPVGLC